MNIVEPLSSISEFSIGLAGFAGIVAMVANSKKEISAALRFRFLNLLYMSFFPGFISLFVIGLSYLSLAEESAVRIGSGMLALALIALTVNAFRIRINMSPSEFMQLNHYVWYFSVSCSILNSAFQIYSVTFFGSVGAGILVLGLVTSLLLAALVFAMIILQVLNESASVT